MEHHPYHKSALVLTRVIGSPASIIVHTIFFILCFGAAGLKFVEFNTMLLVLTTLVSLEAIYLAIFIQMTINYTTESIVEVSEDIKEIQEDVGEVQEDVGEIQKDVDEIQGDVDEIQVDMDELQEDVEEISEDDASPANMTQSVANAQTLVAIQADLRKLLADFEQLQKLHAHAPKAALPITPTISQPEPVVATKKPARKPKKSTSSRL